jgi:hypothetical protein
MDRTVSAAHAGHDELLVARLYGGDVDEAERTRALELLADCEECAVLFADLGAIAGAVAAMTVPPRPRDFSLTEEDAARLRRGRRVWARVFGLGLRRSLGGSLAALGLAGVMFAGAASFLGVGGAALNAAPARVANAADQGSAAGPSGGEVPRQVALPPNFAATAAPAATEAPAPAASVEAQPSAATVSGPSAQDGGFGPQPQPTASPEAKAAGSGMPEAAAGPGGNDMGQRPTPQTEATSQGGVDARLIWLVGFGVLFAVGLALLLLPLILRSRRRAI